MNPFTPIAEPLPSTQRRKAVLEGSLPGLIVAASLCCCGVAVAQTTAAVLPKDGDNVVRDSPSADAKGSMPIGNGAIGLNVRGVSEPGAELVPLTNRGDNALARLQFKNAGVVRSDMRFEWCTQACYYVETPFNWSCPWGSPQGGASYPYLGLVDELAKPVSNPRPDILFEDFESATYGRWKVEGEAFGTGPFKVGSVRFHAPISGQTGEHIAISFPTEERDGLRGKLTSQPFKIERDHIRFVIAGGAHAKRTCMNLIVAGQTVRTATGGNSHALRLETWDVREFAGREALLQIVDDEPDGWGHVLVDQIVFTDAGPPKVLPPPIGIRSAVPLGGLGAGTVELRADGSFRDWNIFNNSPGGGGGKVQLEEALFGLWVKSAGSDARSWTLRTHPPQGLPAISQIEYAGAYPVSRLRFADAALPLAVDLYAYSEFVMRNAPASATPAVIFSFNLANPSAQPIEAAILFNLPNHPQGLFSPTANGLRLERAGTTPVSGSMVLRFEGAESITAGVGDDLSELWRSLATNGALPVTPPGEASGRHGAVVARVTIEPGESRTLSLVLGWYFPHRTHAGERIGNYYTRLYDSTEDVAAKVLARLPQTWEALAQWQQTCLDNGLPEWLQDALLNSVATMAKTGIWAQDGRWRQWESFSCSALEPVHIHWYRSLPYALFFPELQKNQFRGFARQQQPEGFIHEDLGNAGKPFDHAGGREMGDCTSAFILGVFKIHLWSGDRPFLDELWPHARKAAQWQIARSERFGLPRHLSNTYDWWSFEGKDVVSYNAVLHLAAMRAAERLAEIEGDGDFARTCRQHFESARSKLDPLLWTGQYYRSWWMSQGGYPDALHADTLYGQLWSSLLGLGWIVEPDKARAHLAAELKHNASPFGLKVMSRRGNEMMDDLVWLSGSVDWSALNLYLGADVNQSLLEAEKLVKVWREHLRDFWDYRDLVRSDNGQPWCNSHYARHLTLWALPLALSGQQFNADQKSLAFDPRPDAPQKLPWFVPGANGVIERLGAGRFRVSVLSGALELAELRVGQRQLRQPIALHPGESVTVKD